MNVPAWLCILQIYTVHWPRRERNNFNHAQKLVTGVLSKDAVIPLVIHDGYLISTFYVSVAPDSHRLVYRKCAFKITIDHLDLIFWYPLLHLSANVKWCEQSSPTSSLLSCTGQQNSKGRYLDRPKMRMRNLDPKRKTHLSVHLCRHSSHSIVRLCPLRFSIVFLRNEFWKCFCEGTILSLESMFPLG